MFKLVLLVKLLVFMLPSGSTAQEVNAREVWKRYRTPADDHSAKPPLDDKKKNGGGTDTRQGSGTTAGKTKKEHSSKTEAARMPAEEVDGSDVASDSSKKTIGLGYTLFLDDGSGELSSVSPTRIFHTGQAVRLLLESSVDGYLYIFHQENDGAPKMLFPSWQDHRGANYVAAHKLIFVPAENRMSLVGDPAAETLILVVSRKAIAGLPFGEELKGRDVVNVPLALFRMISDPCRCREDRDDTEGKPGRYTNGARDVQLTKTDPLPAYIILNEDRSANRLTARITLRHE